VLSASDNDRLVAIVACARSKCSRVRWAGRPDTAIHSPAAGETCASTFGRPIGWSKRGGEIAGGAHARAVGVDQ